jgi:acetolactate decarboxylase
MHEDEDNILALPYHQGWISLIAGARMMVMSRRSVVMSGLGWCACAACAAEGMGASANTASANELTRGEEGPGYRLHFVGAQRETIMNGKLAAAIDLRTLAGTPHLYGIGPLEELRGEVTIIDTRPSLARVNSAGAVAVTENYDGGAPFLIWAEVTAWRDLPIPADVRSFADLEASVPRAAQSAGLDPQKPVPFMLRGRQDLIEFHVLNRIGDAPHNMQQHKKIQVTFELEHVDAMIVGFHSTRHRGIFTPMDSAIHIHFQTPDNRASGHIQKLQLGTGLMLSLPRPS